MELKINFIKNTQTQQVSEFAFTDNRNTKWKTYISDDMDDDMKKCTISHKVGTAILNDVIIDKKSQIDDLIEFLENLKPSLSV